MKESVQLNSIKVNNQLRHLYIENIPNLEKMYKELYNLSKSQIISNVDNGIEKDKPFDDFSHPFMLKCINEYCNTPVRIMVFGKETYAWDPIETCDYKPHKEFYEFISSKEDIDDFMNLYESKKNQANKNIFNRYLKIISSIFGYIDSEGNGNPCCISWNNLNKFGKASESGTAYDIVIQKELEYFNVIKKEIQYLKPDVCLFFTGYGYDRFIENKFPDVKFSTIEGCNDNFQDLNMFAKLTSKDLPKHSYRTYHPRYGNTIPDLYIGFLQKIKELSTSSL